MTTVAIVYHSGMGNTAKVAHAIAEGARTVSGADVHVLELTGEQIIDGRWQDDTILETLQKADAIIFGSP
ncbi:MAG: flavodoxin family protein, partial [Chloroflexota bacterium]